MAEMFGLYSLWGILLLGPPFGFANALWLRKHFPYLIRRTLIVCASMIAVVALGWLLNIGWLWDLMNVLSVAIAYLAYCLIFGLLWVFGRSIWSVALAGLATLPILGGYIVGTVGAMGLVFVLGDVLSPPLSETALTSSLYCRVKGWGYAFSDEGYDVILYRHPPFLPVVGWEVRRVRVDETNPGDGPKSANCDGVTKGPH